MKRLWTAAIFGIGQYLQPNSMFIVPLRKVVTFHHQFLTITQVQEQLKQSSLASNVFMRIPKCIHGLTSSIKLHTNRHTKCMILRWVAEIAFEHAPYGRMCNVQNVCITCTRVNATIHGTWSTIYYIMFVCHVYHPVRGIHFSVSEDVQRVCLGHCSVHINACGKKSCQLTNNIYGCVWV